MRISICKLYFHFTIQNIRCKNFDHIMACYDLKNYNNKVKFYANDLDANAIELAL